MKICFSTFAYSDNYKIMMEQMIASCKHFHPDISIEVTYKDKLDEILKNNNNRRQIFGAYLGKELSQNYDLIIHLDADCIITGELTELLSGDYDVASVRNNNDYGKAGKGKPGFTRTNVLNKRFIQMQEYVNAGCYGVTNKNFWDDWFKATLAYSNTCLLEDQDTFNDLFYSGKYKSVVIDSPDKPYYYGVANTWGENSHYESWREIELKDDKLFLRGKQIKILHAASGESTGMKFDFEKMFKPNVSAWLKNIIGLKE